MDNPLTPRKNAINFLISHKIAHLATTMKNGTPSVSSIYYLANPKMEIYITTMTETEKYENILNSSSVALVVTDEKSLRTIQIKGVTTESINPKERMVALEALAVMQAKNKSGWPPPIVKMNKGKLKVIKILPTWVRYSDFKNPNNVIQFETIIPYN